MKKYLALIIAVLMVLALLPLAALAESDEPIEDEDPIEEPIDDEDDEEPIDDEDDEEPIDDEDDEEPIDDDDDEEPEMPEDAVIIEQVEIFGFVEPAPGEPFSAELTVPEGAHYYIENCGWIGYNEEESFMLEEGDILTDTDSWYYMYVHVRPEEGYAFSEGLIALMNGEKELFEIIEASRWYLGELLTFDYYFGEEAEDPDDPDDPDEDPYLIEEVYLNGIVPPEFNEAPSYDVTVPEGSFYRIVSVEWYRYDEDWEPVLMSEEELCNDTGTSYFMRILLDFYEESFRFADYVEVFTDNEDDDPIWYAEVGEDGVLEVMTCDYDVYDPDEEYDPDDPVYPDDPDEPDEPDGDDIPDMPIDPYPIPEGYATSTAKTHAAPPATGGMSFALIGAVSAAAGAVLLLRKKEN